MSTRVFGSHVEDFVDFILKNKKYFLY